MIYTTLNGTLGRVGSMLPAASVARAWMAKLPVPGGAQEYVQPVLVAPGLVTEAGSHWNAPQVPSSRSHRLVAVFLMATSTVATARSSVALPARAIVGASGSCWLGAGVVTVPSGGTVSGGMAVICTDGRVASSLPAKSHACTVIP